MIANSLARKSPFFRRNLTVNKSITTIKIIKLKNTDSYVERIAGYSSLDENICFLIEHVKKFDTFFFNTKIDLVATDMYHKAIMVIHDLVPDTIPSLPKETRNIWVLSVGTILTHNIKLKDCVSTH